jgi:hypothetical protein
MPQRPISEEIKARVIELHVKEKMGLRAISKYFKGKPARTSIQRILSEAGIYLGPQRMEDQQAAKEKRQAAVIQSEKERRHKIAVCLWNLRKGIPVERTCIENGWQRKAAWYLLGKHPRYRQLRDKIERPYKFTRIEQRKKLISRIYPRESNFTKSIEKRLRDSGLAYEVEPSIPDTRLRADFRVGDCLIECKVDTTHTKLKICIGQSCVYRHIGSSQPVVIIPDDVDMRYPFDRVLKALDVVMLSEEELVPWLRERKSLQENY